MKEKPRQFDALKFANVLKPARISRVDVITLDAERTGSFAFPLAPVATETIEHQLDHVTLAVVRRRHMGENKQFHSNL